MVRFDLLQIEEAAVVLKHLDAFRKKWKRQPEELRAFNPDLDGMVFDKQLKIRLPAPTLGWRHTANLTKPEKMPAKETAVRAAPVCGAAGAKAALKFVKGLFKRKVRYFVPVPVGTGVIEKKRKKKWNDKEVALG